MLFGCTAVVAGCNREASRPATAEECRAACEHVAALNRPVLEENARTRVHEQEEAAEALEAGAKKNIARVKKEMTEPRPPFEKTLDAVRKVPRATMQQLRARYELQGQELRRQREAALKAAENEIVVANAAVEKNKKSFAADLQKVVEADARSCSDQCIKNSAPKKSVECMNRATAADQVPPCLVVGSVKR